MESFARCGWYVRVGILFFSLATTTAAGSKYVISSFNERENDQHGEDGIVSTNQNKDEIATPSGSSSSSSSSSASSSSTHSSWSKLRYSLFTNDDGYDAGLQQQRLCDIGDGYIYREDEKLVTFETRCGSIEQFPCYCAPDLDPPISCPYCGFHSSSEASAAATAAASTSATINANAERRNDSKSDDFFCLKDGEISDPFVGNGGASTATIQECSCRIEQGTPEPISFCQPVQSGTPKRPASRPPLINNNNNDDDDDESRLSSKPKAQPTPTNPMNLHTHSPMPEPTPKPSLAPIQNSMTGNEDTKVEDKFSTSSRQSPLRSVPKDIKTEIETEAPPGTLSDIETFENADDICSLELEGGTTKTFQRGESYGVYLPTRCNQPNKFPCFCNPDLYTQVECPYCSFRTGNGDLLCAKHEQTVSFPVPGSDDARDIETCTCWVPEDPTQKPFDACSVSSQSMDDSPEQNNDNGNDVYSNGGIEGCDVFNPTTGKNVIIPIGESFAKYLEVEGACGDCTEWPAYCSADMDTTNNAILTFSKQETPNLPHSSNIFSSIAVYISNREDITYPYCVFSDTLSETPICAKDDENVVYTTEEGKRIQCSCSYSSNGGAQSTCSPYLARSSDGASSGGMHRTKSSDGVEVTSTHSHIATPMDSHSSMLTIPQRDTSGAIGRNIGGHFIICGILRSAAVWALGHIMVTTIL
jgi:hypothetical protein